jgi:hypothetical protein
VDVEPESVVSRVDQLEDHIDIGKSTDEQRPYETSHSES